MTDRLFTKAELCRDFGLSPKTLDYLVRSKTLDLAWQTRHGLMVCPVTDADKRVLSCARNHISCFGANKLVTLPFLRFLFLRFFQMPDELIVYELKERNIYNFDAAGTPDISVYREWFASRLPEVLRPLHAEMRAPETDEEDEWFSVFLDTCELSMAYDHPEIELGMQFMSIANVKAVVDAALSTQGTFEEIAALLEELAGLNISPTGLVFYQALFHDISSTPPDEMKVYYAGLAPSHRQEIRTALGQPLNVYRVQSGLDVTFNADQVFDNAMQMVAREMLNTAVLSTEASDKFHSLLKSFNMLVDRQVKLNAGSDTSAQVRVPEFMRSLKLQDADLEDGLLQLPKPQLGTGTGAS